MITMAINESPDQIWLNRGKDPWINGWWCLPTNMHSTRLLSYQSTPHLTRIIDHSIHLIVLTLWRTILSSGLAASTVDKTMMLTQVLANAKRQKWLGFAKQLQCFSKYLPDIDRLRVIEKSQGRRQCFETMNCGMPSDNKNTIELNFMELTNSSRKCSSPLLHDFIDFDRSDLNGVPVRRSKAYRTD